MSAQLKPLGDWVNQLFDTIFFDSDDNNAIKAFTEGFDPSFSVKINHDSLSYDQYKEAIHKTRAQSEITLQDSSEILKWDDAEQKGGTVAHLFKFVVKDKTTGKETNSTNLLLTAVKWIDGKRVITEITEIAV
ncbi:uncharacterized protein BKCO1_1400027 [Diplodia corticola]|uniref:Uncharacterized protein n=1 Tax=Diplodia corticola TaxID=236234 RepID=A0A1J9S5T5_9PEZI|nr:uncharacterized protein BKCO1_1400027 [Diplodia corticola]OJD35879.1 hypothetical protein BKCO1_1400027 [Diplodia corticola]